jgi:two-component system, NarL family, nitrate/nitrite response regulator NarL
MIRILVVSDVRFHREGLQRMLAAEADLTVVGVAADEHQALGAIRAGGTELVLLDLVLRDGRSLVRAIHDIAPAVHVVALGLSDTGSSVLPWAEAGVAGYVGQNCSFAELVAVVRSIAQGGSPCAPDVSAALFKRIAILSERPLWRDATARLTPRESEIAALLARGMSNREIARTLTISLPTVKNHVHNVLDKLQVTRRADVAGQVMGPAATARRPES